MCPACGHTFAFNEDEIPEGAKYEAHCPVCGISFLKKKHKTDKKLTEFVKKKQETASKTGGSKTSGKKKNKMFLKRKSPA